MSNLLEIYFEIPPNSICFLDEVPDFPENEM